MDGVPDGLDATRRRVLLRLGGSFRVCADVVDDDAEYAALVGMVQPFRSRYPLVEGRGNFGSVDGDPPADPPYTEARMSALGRLLPRFPNALVNGRVPHNLGEAAAAVIAFAEDPGLTAGQLMAHLPGPDFPTGGVIADPSELRRLYETGAATLTLRARTHREEHAIVVTELPFTVEKGGDRGVIVEIADAHGRGVLAGIADLIDESDRDGMRLVVVVDSEADPGPTLAALLEHTSLEIRLPLELGLPLPDLLRLLVGDRDAVRLRYGLEDVTRRFGDARRTTIG
jgi:DNA gyrase subunit A